MVFNKKVVHFLEEINKIFVLCTNY